MYIVVSYDVVCDRRRARLAKRLVGRLHRVQKSVFEGEVTDKGLQLVLQDVQREIDPTEDSVRVYHLCRGCEKTIDLVGVAPTWAKPDEDEVV
ncbi:MAG TPA: CRISPR-associated endonuclease Cas2 [Thermoanaerobaculaceae bacterium]|nr:CRISPR-associated endonuclease Cas2 [Thermoanaerobaculaceae bacterium]HRS15453.1 CRISPR-associated endonuclease Cas2 [Thermoanaerobaculaceae bacterium]